MKVIIFISIFIGLLMAQHISSNNKLLDVTTLPFQRDTNQKLKTFDYSFSYKPMAYTKNTNLEFLKNGNSFIFFFSATCPHCQQTIPKVLGLKSFFKKTNTQVIAIPTYHNSDKQVYNFISKYKVDIPVLADKQQAFAVNYGTGFVPVVLIVNAKGNFVRVPVNKQFEKTVKATLLRKEFFNSSKKSVKSSKKL